MIHTELSFRLADAADAELVSDIITDVSDGIVDALLDETFWPVDSKGTIAWLMKYGAGCYCSSNIILMENEGRPAGLLFAYPSSEHGIPESAQYYIKRRARERLHDILTASCTDCLHINTVWVAPDQRGTGIGSELLWFAEDLSRRKGLRGVGLFVWADNTSALGFYKRHGYRRSRIIPSPNPPIYGKNGPHTAGGYIMFKAC